MIPIEKVKLLLIKHQDIEKELSSGTIHKPNMSDLGVKRELKLITNPSRYTSKASAAFKKDILPHFASLESPLRKK